MGQLQVPLLNSWAKDHLAPDANCRGLRPGNERRHLHFEVGAYLGPAGKAPARPQLVGRESPEVEGARRAVPGRNLHPALLAGAVPAAGRVDGDPVPAGRVEHGDAPRDAHLTSTR